MKVAVYCRVSTDMQELEQQVAACLNFCRFKGFEYEVFQDIGSGKNLDRQDFQRMLPRLRAKELQGIVVFRFDRIGRNAREVVTLFEEFEKKGIEVFSISENIDTSSPVGRAVRDIIIRLAQLERENISDATRQRLQALKNLGKRLGRPNGSKDKKQRRKSGYYQRWTKQKGVEIPAHLSEEDKKIK